MKKEAGSQYINALQQRVDKFLDEINSISKVRSERLLQDKSKLKENLTDFLYNNTYKEFESGLKDFLTGQDICQGFQSRLLKGPFHRTLGVLCTSYGFLEVRSSAGSIPTPIIRMIDTRSRGSFLDAPVNDLKAQLAELFEDEGYTQKKFGESFNNLVSFKDMLTSTDDTFERRMREAKKKVPKETFAQFKSIISTARETVRNLPEVQQAIANSR